MYGICMLNAFFFFLYGVSLKLTVIGRTDCDCYFFVWLRIVFAFM